MDNFCWEVGFWKSRKSCDLEDDTVGRGQREKEGKGRRFLACYVSLVTLVLVRGTCPGPWRLIDFDFD